MKPNSTEQSMGNNAGMNQNPQMMGQSYPSGPLPPPPQSQYPPQPQPTSNNPPALDDNTKVLGIVALVLAFSVSTAGLIMSIVGRAKAKKILKNTGQKAQGDSILTAAFACSIITILVQVVLIIFLVVGLGRFNWAAGKMVGTWTCKPVVTSLGHDITMTFTNRTYDWDIDGVKKSGSFIVEPARLDPDIWESVKSALPFHYDITDDEPEARILTLGTGETVRTVIFNQRSGGHGMLIQVDDTDIHYCDKFF